MSSVCIKDQKQNVVKKNKEAREEGKRILECFRINTENPIAILQQEEAKELLKVESVFPSQDSAGPHQGVSAEEEERTEGHQRQV